MNKKEQMVKVFLLEEIKRLSVVKEEFIDTFAEFERQNNIDLPDPF